MGAWGVALFSDDLAADLREDFRELIGEGLSSTQAVEKLLVEYASSLEDDDERSVFWIALASVQWKLGQLEDRTRQNALSMIESGQDLKRWDDPRTRMKRAAVLEKLRLELSSPQPDARQVRRRIKEANDWSLGEVLGLRLQSGNWTLVRVIGYHEDKGGRFAVCELLDWVGVEFPTEESIAKLQINSGQRLPGISQFMLQKPFWKKDRARMIRLGIVSTPAQKCGGYTVVLWKFSDRMLKELFGLE